MSKALVTARTALGVQWRRSVLVIVPDVKMVAGSIQFRRTRLAKNATDNADDPEVTLRNLRLLEEAVLFCESQNLALVRKAAGVEWHDRQKAAQ